MKTIGSTPIPESILLQHTIALGKTRSGKSSAIRYIVEHQLEQGRRVSIIDPKGDWFGLKLSHSGKGPGFRVVIFGGEHADVPINAHSGAQIAQLVGSGNLPCIIDLGGWTVGDRTRFFIDYAQTLFKTNKAPLLQVIDEVHNFAPESRGGLASDPQRGMMVHWANRLASEGTGKGIILLAASQRPQKTAKDFVTSMETLIAMRVIHPLDRKAMKEWIDGCENPDKGTEVLDSLASMERGEAWVWSPEPSGSYRGFGPERIRFPKFSTYDSFAAQTGERSMVLKGWAEVDLDEVRKQLASVVKEAEANDPKALRRRIADLEAQVKARPAPGPDPKQRLERMAGEIKERDRLLGHYRNVVRQLEKVPKILSDAAARVQASCDETKVLGQPATPAEPPRALPPSPQRPAPPRPAPRPRAGEDLGDSLSAPLQRIVNAIAWWEAAGNDHPTGGQAAVAAGYSPGSGTINKYFSTLSAAGMIDRVNGDVSLTDAGRGKAEAVEFPATLEELHARIHTILAAPLRRVIEVVIGLGPGTETHADQVAAAAGYEPGSGTINKYFSTLSKLGLIVRRSGLIAPSEILFPERLS